MFQGKDLPILEAATSKLPLPVTANRDGSCDLLKHLLLHGGRGKLEQAVFFAEEVLLRKGRFCSLCSHRERFPSPRSSWKICLWISQVGTVIMHQPGMNSAGAWRGVTWSSPLPNPILDLWISCLRRFNIFVYGRVPVCPDLDSPGWSHPARSGKLSRFAPWLIFGMEDHAGSPGSLYWDRQW